MRLTQADPCRKIVLLWIKKSAPSFFTSSRVRACAMSSPQSPSDLVQRAASLEA